MSLMTLHERQIRQRKSKSIQYDLATGNVRLLDIEKNIYSSLGNMLKLNLMAEIEKRNLFQNANLINHNRMRNIIHRAFEKITNDKGHPMVCCWSRGRLKRDEYLDYFSALNIAFENDPNRIYCFNIVNETGSKRSIRYKHTHVHYVRQFNRFIILEQIAGMDRRLEFLQINMNELDMPGQSITIVSLGKRISYRQFYATAFDYKKSVLYVIGGNGMDSKTVMKVEPFKITMGPTSRLTIENMPTFDFEKLQVTSAICCYAFINGQETTGIMAVGGLLASEVLNYQNFQFKPTCFYYSLQKNIRSSFGINWNEFGAYSHVVQIPVFNQIEFTHPYKDKRKICSGALLVFGGTNDYVINAMDNRRSYGKPIIFIPKFLHKVEIASVTVVPLGGQPISGPDVKLSNHLYPYLNDHTASIVYQSRTGYDRPMPVIRIMVPIRDSGVNKYERCFVLEVILEPELEKTSIIEYEAQAILPTS